MLRLSLLAILILGLARSGGAHHVPEPPPQPEPRSPSPSVRGPVDALFEALAIKQPEQRTLAPDVPLTDTEGKAGSLKDFRGKLVLLNFWATWCIPCLTEMPELERLHSAYRHMGFVVVAISTDAQGPEFVRKYVAEKQFTFPAFSDPMGLRAGIPLRLIAIPASYLISPDGELLGFAFGPREWAGPEAMALVAALTDAGRKKRVGSR